MAVQVYTTTHPSFISPYCLPRPISPLATPPPPPASPSVSSYTRPYPLQRPPILQSADLARAYMYTAKSCQTLVAIPTNTKSSGKISLPRNSAVKISRVQNFTKFAQILHDDNFLSIIVFPVTLHGTEKSDKQKSDI